MTDTEQPKLRIVIGMPCGDYVHYLTALHFAGLLSYTRERGVEAIPVMNAGSMPNNNRTLLMRAAVEHKADALLLIDSDMVMPPDSLLRLLAHGEDKDIIGATYAQRQPKGPAHGQEIDGARINVLDDRDAVREVQTLPCGMLLIRKRVWEIIEQPYFRYPFKAHAELSGSEDFDFCRRASELGFRVWLDPVLSRALGHVGTAIYTIAGNAQP